MPTALEPGKKIKRMVKVYGIESLVEATFAHEGISFRVPGTRSSLFATWPDVIEKAAVTPDNVPCFLAGEPTEFLKHGIAKAEKRRAKREGAA